MRQDITLKSLIWTLALSTALLIGAANTHVHIDHDALTCDVCLLSDHTETVVDTSVKILSSNAFLPINQTPVALSLQQAILGFLIRGPPAQLPA